MFQTSQNLIMEGTGYSEIVTDPSQTDSLISQDDSDIPLAVTTTSHTQENPHLSYVHPDLIQTDPYVIQANTNPILNGSGYTKVTPGPTQIDPHVFQTTPNLVQSDSFHIPIDPNPLQNDLDLALGGASSFTLVDPFQTHVRTDVSGDVSGPSQAKTRRIRALFQMIPESMSSAEKRKLFVKDFTDHMNELAGQIFAIDGTVKKKLEISVFGTELTGAEIDAAEIKLKKHIIALQKHNISNVITGAVPIRYEATLAEAAAYFRLRECISAIKMSMKWEDRIRRYVTISHLGYAKHVIKNLGSVFEILDHCTKAMSTIWNPIKTDGSLSQSVFDFPEESKQYSGASISHAPYQKSKLTKLMDKLEIKRTPSRVTRKRINKNRRRNQLTRDDEKVAIPTAVNQKIYIRYDGSGYVSESRKDSPSPGRKRGRSRSSRKRARRNKARLQTQMHQDEVTPGETVPQPISQTVTPRRSSVSITSVEVDNITSQQLKITSTNQESKRRPDSDPERETKRHFSFSGLKGNEAPKDVTSRASSPSDHSDQEKIASDDHSAMRILEAQLYYFQLVCTKFLQTLAEISEKLKDPSQIWYKDTQYENIFVDKIDSIIRSMPDEYLLKPLGVVRKRLEDAIMNFGGIITV